MGVSQIRANAFRGVVEENEEKRAVNRTGGSLSQGNIVALDLSASESEVTALGSFVLNPDNDTEDAHPFNNVINVASAHMSGWIFGVVKEASVADDEWFTLILAGITQVELDSTVSAQDQIMPTTGATDATVLTDGNACVGIAMEAGPSSGTSNGLAIFDGRVTNGAAGSA